MKTTQAKAETTWLAGKLPFYYGWLIALVAILTQLTTGVGQT